MPQNDDTGILNESGAGEELLSGSRDLQNLQDALQAFRKELQSTSAELDIVKHGLRIKSEQLNEDADDTSIFFRTTREPLLYLDSELRIRNASGAFYSKFGLTPAGSLNRLLSELNIAPWNNRGLVERLKAALGEGSSFSDLEISYESTAGEASLLLNASAFYRRNGEAGILLSIEDLRLGRTENSRLIESNRALEERIRLAVEATGIGTWEFDPENRTLITDEQSRKLFGFAADEYAGYDDFNGALHPDDRFRRDRILSNAMAGRDAGRYEVEYRIFRKDTGHIRWINSKGQAFFGDDGRATRIVGTLIDITPHKTAEQSLKESEERFRLAADAAAAMIWMCGPEDKCNYFNKSWLQFRGKSLEEEVGDGWKEGVHPEDAERVLQYYVTSIKARQEFYLEYRLRRFDGEYRWISDAGVPRFSPSGVYEGYVGTCIDIHTPKMTNEELEGIIAERTASLNEAIADLRTSNQNLEEFAYIASHDLQEPLRKIQAFATLLESKSKGQLNEDTSLYLTKIKNASQRMSQLIDDLLDYSRLGKKDDAVETNLEDVIREVISDFDITIRQKGADIRFVGLPVITAIPIHMHQLFYNLMSNALKFSKDDVAPAIDITSVPLLPSEREQYPSLSRNFSYAHVVFADNGIGFNQEYNEKVFDIFQRLNGRSMYEGTGIGLAICRKIVNNLAGHMYAESEEGVGTSFHIFLPVGEAKVG